MVTPTTAAEARPPPQRSAPDLSMIAVIHRGAGGFVPFAAKPGGKFQHLFSIEPTSIPTVPMEAVRHLQEDAYFGINGMSRPARSRSKMVPTLPGAYRQTEGLRYLNAAYVDIDVRDEGTDVERTVTTLLSMVQAGELPPLSLLVRSGRGVWLLWLLQDTTTGGPPLADDAAVRAYSDLERAIQRRLAHLGADSAATDAARVMRVPGSVHSGTGQRVTFHPQPDQAGRLPTYTLADLAAKFGVTPRVLRPISDVRPRPWEPRLPNGERRQPVKRGGWANLFRSRARQLRTLWQMRGGYAEGCRNRAALLLADSLIRLCRPSTEVVQAIRELGAACHPPLLVKECEHAVRSAATGKYKFRNDTISDWLDIQQCEAERLETWKPATRLRNGGGLQEKGARRDLRKARRHLILRLIYEHGGELPPTRRLTVMLREHGHRASHTTVWKDLRGMGLVGQEGPSALTTPQPPFAA
jgi:hypothetical protein